MTTLDQFHHYAEEIESLMALHSYPLAVKMVEKGEELPSGVMRPKSDLGCHLSQCQAFTLSRRKGLALATVDDDHWCWGPIMAYGIVDQRIADDFPEIREDVKRLPLLEPGKYCGIVSAPLRSCTFVPQAVLIYSNVAQLNNMLHALSFAGEGLVDTPIYPIASCAWSVVPSLRGKYAVTIPDPGELGRAFAFEDEIIFSLPAEKVELLVRQLHFFRDELGWEYKRHDRLEIRPDFPRPDFYKRLFKVCGLDAPDL